MAHAEQLSFVARVKNSYPDFFLDKRVLEVGSYDVNGSVRCFFERCDYTGLDVSPGKGVDVVCPGQDYRTDRGFDTAVSCEMLEHNPFWKETLQNMVSMLVPGGLMVVSCATTGRQEHGTRRSSPLQSLGSEEFGDYYLNLTESDIRGAMSCDEDFESIRFEEDHRDTHDIYFVALKKECQDTGKVSLPSLAPYLLRGRDTFLPDKPIHLFYHMYCVGDFLERFELVRGQLAVSGLSRVLSLMHIVAVGPEVSRACQALLGKSDGVLLYTPQVPGHTEAPTLGILKDFCSHHDVYALYLHGKGVTVPNSTNVAAWRDYLLHFVVQGWQTMVRSLGVFDAAGVQLQDHERGAHYSGNFWWTSSRFVRTLDRLGDNCNRFDCEFWLGTAERYKLFSAHHVDKQLYSEMVCAQDCEALSPFAIILGHKASSVLFGATQSMEERGALKYWPH